MPRVKWDDKYLIGIEQFDDDHKNLVNLMNDIYDTFISCKLKAYQPQELLDSLTEYTKIHFSNEEKWMLDFDYPNLEEHVLDHKRFILKLSEFDQNFKDGSGHLTIEIFSFLRVWLLTHILVVDLDLGVFSRARSIQGKAMGQ